MTQDIKIFTKESETPIVSVKARGNVGRNPEDDFDISDDNRSEVSVLSVSRRRKRSQGNSPQNTAQTEALHNSFGLFSNEKKVKPNPVQEEPVVGGDSPSDNESEISGLDDSVSQFSDDSRGSGGSGGSRRRTPKDATFVTKRLTHAEIQNKKQEYLIKLMDLDSKGIKLTRKFDMDSDLNDMILEYNRHKQIAERDASVKFSRKMLMACVTGLEYLNGRFDPFRVKLDGWSESVMENIGDYDKIFERLAEKYSGKGEMAPELELMISLAGSAFMFHLQKTMFSALMPPGGFKANPDIMGNIAKAMQQTSGISQNTQNSPQQAAEMSPPPGIDLGSLMGGFVNSMGGGGGSGSFQLPQMTRGRMSEEKTKFDMEENRFSEISSTISSGSSSGGSSRGSSRSTKKISINIDPKSKKGKAPTSKKRRSVNIG